MTRLRVSLDATAVPRDPTGAGRYVLELVRALELGRDDVEVEVFCRRGDVERWMERVRNGAVLERAPRARPLRLIWEQVGLPWGLRRLRPGVHHGPHYTMPEHTRIPCVVTVHDLTFFDHPEWHEPAKARFFRRAIRRAAAGADALVCVSETTATRLRDLLDPTAAVRVIPHGVDHVRFRPMGSTASRPYIAFVGTLEPRKDVPTLVRAFDRVATRRPDLHLVLAGRADWGADAVDGAVAASPHRDRIRRPGYLPEDEIARLLSGAAAVAYPSLEEGFGLPALEAMACGAPVVTTAGTAMAEVVGQAGVLVPPGDAGALAEALELLLDGGTEVARRRALGLERAAGYTWEASAAAHVEVYRSVAR